MPTITTNSSQWLELYSETGIAPGTPLLVQNQSSLGLPVRIRKNENEGGGYRVDPGMERQATDAQAIYARCVGGLNIYVQEFDE